MSLQKLNELLKALKDDQVEKSPTHFTIKHEGTSILTDFMQAAGEPITWVEAIELWHNMRQTNISELPTLEESLHTSIHKQIQYQVVDFFPIALDHGSTNHMSPLVEEIENEDNENRHQQGKKLEKNIEIGPQSIQLMTRNSYRELVFDLSHDAIINIARSIKETYGIRLSDDSSEFYFILGSQLLIWCVVIILIIIGQFHPSKSLGSFTWEVIVEANVLFIAEVLWECVLSAVALRYNIKINYTRKLGNLFKVPKYFAADLFPFYESTAISLVTALAVNQTYFSIMYYRKSRERIPFFSYVFLSQDRREDRPDTLIFQITEDILRFAIYFPFKILVANPMSVPAIIFIPVAVNNIGDGLAEPVGVRFGKHKYSTTALYHKGKFFKSKFTRSYEGSSCVFITTFIVVAINYKAFTSTQFWITFSFLPFLMTLAEAKAPHTNDGPFLALVGCGFLSFILLLI